MSMDKAISDQKIFQNKLRASLKYIVFLGIGVIAFIGFRKILKTEIVVKDFLFATLETGLIENTISASGLVTPLFETQVNAPISTEIQKFHVDNGAVVNAGDLLLSLDSEFIGLEYEALNDQLELKNNNITKLKLEYDKNLKDLDFDDQIKALALEALNSQLADIKRLNKIGAATDEEVEKAILDLQIANLEKQKLFNELQFRRKVIGNEKRNLEIEVEIQKKKILELKRKLKETKVRTKIDGVVTWINQNIGQKVLEGEPLAKIANLNNFRVNASCSDRYGSKIKVGMPCKIRINRTMLEGNVASIAPAITNNTIDFVVDLKDKENILLKPNLRVEVFLIIDKKENALRVINGAAFSGAKEQKVFVVKGDQAIAETVQIGINNIDYIEITSGNLKKGDRIIVSDMAEYDHLDVIELKAENE